MIVAIIMLLMYLLLQKLHLFYHTEGRTQNEVAQGTVLRRILCPKRKEVIGIWRQLCIENLHDLHSSPSSIRMTK